MATSEVFSKVTVASVLFVARHVLAFSSTFSQAVRLIYTRSRYIHESATFTVPPEHIHSFNHFRRGHSQFPGC